MEKTPKTYIAEVVAVDQYGNETQTTVPIKAIYEPTSAEIVNKLDTDYPHLTHRVAKLDELRSPEQVEDWHHSFMGVIFGEDIHKK